MYALADYGFTTDTVVTSFPEERRQWRVKIENHVTDESQKTRDHVDERVDETIEPHLDTIEEKVDDVKTYLQNEVVNSYLAPIKQTVEQVNSYIRGTLTSYVDDVEGNTDTLEDSQTAQSTLLNKIWTRVQQIPTVWP
jgi:hypothetical protein